MADLTFYPSTLLALQELTDAADVDLEFLVAASARLRMDPTEAQPLADNFHLLVYRAPADPNSTQLIGLPTDLWLALESHLRQRDQTSEGVDVTDEYRIDPENPDPEVVREATEAKNRQQSPPLGKSWSLAWDRDGRRDPALDRVVELSGMVFSLDPGGEHSFEPFPLTEDPATFRDLVELVDAYRQALQNGVRHAVRVPAVTTVLVLPAPSRAAELACWYGLNWVRGDMPNREQVDQPGPFEFTGTPAAIAALLRAVTA
jgi:hypothetical protein